ncbi:lysostaphin resistance A-like protein [Anoxybacillus sp. J5B_2022]|uniref:CPBP family intramembrane glutamic endopeptidase n=1 Tax=Anoxybacillus sp. J5B_2022 TaxID=3003246 RepID=UPI003FA478FD
MQTEFTPKESKCFFIIFLLLLLLINFCKYFLLITKIRQYGSTLEILNTILIILLWIVPVFVYIRVFLKSSVFKFMKLKDKILKNIFTGFLLSILLSLLLILSHYDIVYRKLSYPLPWYIWINTILLSALSEEIVFRGLTLQVLKKWCSFWCANLFTSCLFLLIHFPQWVSSGNIVHILMSWTPVYVVVLSLIFGFVFHKTNSLWSVIILHSFHNYFAILITFN